MKKACLFIAAAMMVFAACKPENKPNKPGDDDPQGDELIIIDGQFADWAAAEGVVTVKNNPEFNGFEMGENARVDALKTMKLAADKYNLYVYFEVDMSIMYNGGVPNWDGVITSDGYAAHLSVFFNTDDNPATGATAWTWTEGGYEYYIECADLCSREGDLGEYEGGTFLKFTGKDGGGVWDDGGPWQEEVSGEGAFAIWRVKEGDIIKCEMSFTRAFMGLTSSNTIRVGAILYQDIDWEMMGLLPQGEGSDTEAWQGAFKPITLP